MLLAVGAAFPGSRVAAQTFVPAPARKDMVYDDARHLVYISAGDRVLRYSPKYGEFRSPLVFGGDLRGIDISPDGKTLVAADARYRKTRAWVWLVDLDSGQARQSFFTNEDWYDTGTFSAVFGADGKVYTTSSCDCSGWTPMRRLDPANNSWTVLASLRDDSALSTSGDGNTIAFAQVDISDGAWGLYRIPSASFVWRWGYQDGTGQFNWEIGTDRTGTRFVLPTPAGAYAYDASYQHLATLGSATFAKPAGVTFHPVEPEFYLPMTSNGQLVAYDANTLAPVRSWPLFTRYGLESIFTMNPFADGRTRISRDGSLLMVGVPGGVSLVRQYAALQAADLGGEVAAGASIDVALAGSIGNGAVLQYSLVGAPAQGNTQLLDGHILRYTAAASGSDRIELRYRAMYGRAWAEATVRLHVTPALPGPPRTLKAAARGRPSRGARLRPATAR